jgi:geranylgeranyl diphosphate synthase type II
MNLKELWNERRQLVEDHLTEELNLDGALDKTLCESMQYSLMAGGKRLRPILLMAAADAVGAKGTDYLESACAIEMIHTYSLIHDDLPAMDDDDYRRGKLTNHKVYGAGMATLAGDALLTLAFEVMLRQPDTTPENILRVVREMSTAAGPDGMVGGQALDLESEDKQISMETLRRMHMGKTGALFRAAIRSGAILGGASAIELSSLTEYADNFGLAFQITDDVLDVTGDEAVIGKPVGSDEKNHKSTYVTLTSLEEAKKLAGETVEDAVKALEPFGPEADFLRELVRYLVDRNK